MQKSIGFNLTSLSDEKITIKRIEKFNEIIFKFFDKHSLMPTYWAPKGNGFNTKLTKFTLRKLKNLKEKKQYLDKDDNLIRGLSYTINPEGSDAPAFDSYFYMNISYSEPLQRLDITLSINPNKIPITKKEFGELFLEYAKLFKIDYGFIYEHEDFEHVNAVILGYNDRNYTKEEWEPFLNWYHSSVEEKLKNPKGLYCVNLLRKDLFQDTIKKLLNKDKEFFDFYYYQGKGFEEIQLSKELDYLSCLTDKDYLEYCI